jgi:hypothetical protein
MGFSSPGTILAQAVRRLARPVGRAVPGGPTLAGRNTWRWSMVDWKLMLFWVAALSLGVATWWLLLSWFGLHGALAAIGLVGLAASAGAGLDHLPPS